MRGCSSWVFPVLGCSWPVKVQEWLLKFVEVLLCELVVLGCCARMVGEVRVCIVEVVVVSSERL